MIYSAYRKSVRVWCPSSGKLYSSQHGLRCYLATKHDYQSFVIRFVTNTSGMMTIVTGSQNSIVQYADNHYLPCPLFVINLCKIKCARQVQDRQTTDSLLSESKPFHFYISRSLVPCPVGLIFQFQSQYLYMRLFMPPGYFCSIFNSLVPAPCKHD